MRSRTRVAGRLLLGLLAAVSIGVAGAALALRASLPALDGSRTLTGLSAPVTIERDVLGVPTVRGASREDVARATGFLHAQDRFFQMDLSRRRAAGELAALVGARALAADRAIRLHRFRAEASKAVSLLRESDRHLLDAYTAGVNDGLAALGARPFEYIVLRQTPQPWRVEDSLLVVLSMFVTLQDDDGTYETTLATMHEHLPPAVYAFLAPEGTEWDAPITGPSFSTPPIPGPEVYDLRSRRRGKPAPSPAPPPAGAQARVTDVPWLAPGSGDGGEAIGSNNWAIGPAVTADGHALVANDMHLGIRVPNTWYRAVFEWRATGDPSPHRLMGLTLPGVPALVTGSNGHVAWGFTNTYADWSDIVLLEIDPGDPERYRTPDGWQRFDHYEETITVAGGPPERMSVRWTRWGPVLPPDAAGRPRAYRWVAHAADRLAARVAPLESARTIEEAFAESATLGTPGQNIVAADANGHIGWSVYGSIPRRVGVDGRWPTSWADGNRTWDGWLPAADVPRVVDPPDGRLWTANARVIDGPGLATLGDGSYEVGSRASIIRDRLRLTARATPRDMLALQLDTRATFLERWRRLLLDTLTPGAVAGHPERAQLRTIVADGWSGTADAGSAAYRFVRTFRDVVSTRVFAFVTVECLEADPAFDYTSVRRREGPLWALVSSQPAHLLDPRYESWTALLLDSVDGTLEMALADGADLGARSWSEFNVVSFRHPLSPALPLVGRWLDMRRRPLPGDLYTPRVHWGTVGASVRMVVSPGREAEGILETPVGQSGHPLSPFYASTHDDWIDGRAVPFLPGPAAHTLTLEPSRERRP